MRTGVDVLLERCLLHKVSVTDYRLHDLVLEYLQFTVKKYENLLRQASSRQARFLSRIEVLRKYSAGGEWVNNGGLYSLVVLWNATKKLDRALIISRYYITTLEGVTEIGAWIQAGRLLVLLVRCAFLLYTRPFCGLKPFCNRKRFDQSVKGLQFERVFCKGVFGTVRTEVYRRYFRRYIPYRAFRYARYRLPYHTENFGTLGTALHTLPKISVFEEKIPRVR